MNRFLRWVAGVVTLAALSLTGTQACAQTDDLTIVVYHDIVDTPSSTDGSDTVTAGLMLRELQWLQRSGHHFVTVDDVLASREGTKLLPEKPVLLTFDDGYSSFYTHAFPVLRMLNIPAVLAIVGSWETPDAQGYVSVDGVRTPGSNFLTRDQIYEVASSGLVEIASHTYEQHKAIAANALGSRIPAVIARAYKDGSIESEEQYERRLVDDFTRNSKFIEALTGHAPRVLVWPYGRYNGTALRAAAKTGHALSLTLDDVASSWRTTDDALGRKYVERQQSFDDFVSYVQRKPQSGRALRHVAVNMETLFPAKATSEAVETRLSHLLDELVASSATAVLVNPFSENCTAYFPQTAHPVERNVLSRVVWQMHTRAHVQVFLDIDVAGCLNAGLARPQLLEMLNAAPFDGLVMRTDAVSEEFSRRLADVFFNEEPNRPVASNSVFPRRTYPFATLNACRLPSEANLSKMAGQNVWVELESGQCDISKAVTRLNLAGVTNWGMALNPDGATVPDVMRLHARGG